MSTTSIEAFPGATPSGPGGWQTAPRVLRFPWVKKVDYAALVLWVFFTTFTLPGSSAILYLLAAYFSAGLILHHRDMLPAILRGWPTLILPLLAIISVFWAPSVGDAVRKGMLLGLTAIVAAYIASRLSVRQILTAYFSVELLAGVLSVLMPNIDDAGIAIGIFNQKNFLAMHMFLLYVTGFTLMLDRKVHPALRAAGAIGLPIALTMIVLSQSATTMLMTAGATMAFLFQVIIWERAQGIRHMRTFMALLAVILLSTIVLVVFGLLQFDALSAVLDGFGKDKTLTGRTYLWDHARRIMDEHPLTGLGASGFWRPEVGTANSLLSFFYYDHFVKFSFHNSYLENGSQFGYPGMYATILLAAWALFASARNWLRNQSMDSAFFLILACMVVMRSNVEVDLATELAGNAILLFVAGMRQEHRKITIKPDQAAPGWSAPRRAGPYSR